VVTRLEKLVVCHLHQQICFSLSVILIFKVSVYSWKAKLSLAVLKTFNWFENLNLMVKCAPFKIKYNFFQYNFQGQFLVIWIFSKFFTENNWAQGLNILLNTFRSILKGQSFVLLISSNPDVELFPRKKIQIQV